MEQPLDQIVGFDCLPEECINKDLLYKHTKRVSYFQRDIPWSEVRELHLIGRDTTSDTGGSPEYYADHDKSWVLVVGIDAEDIWRLLRRCSSQLKKLTIQYTDLRKLDLQKLPGLRTLHLCKNFKLDNILGLGQLTQLEVFTLHDTQIKSIVFPQNLGNVLQLELQSNSKLQEISGLNHLTRLTSLYLRSTSVKKIELTDKLPNLVRLDATHTQLADADFLTMLPRLRVLELGFTNIESISSLCHCRELETLDLSFTPIHSLDGIAFPETLSVLDLQGCKISRIPDAIRQLPKLLRLNLADLQLESLPSWLPKLGLTVGRSNSSGIYLADTTVTGVEMTIFDRPQEMIHTWFDAQIQSAANPDPEPADEEDAPLNELKIVFLGDGGAGKSRTIARLKADGNNVKNFPNIATPGIFIQDHLYEIGDRTVRVHFWDFGGQDIFHSMHQMFLTERTLYVVMLNVRNDTQQRQGRYWLNNLRTFAKNATVMIVLNQMDTNENATIDEEELREIYPNLTEVVRMSALTDTPESMKENLIAKLKQQISVTPSLDTTFPPAWRKLKNRLRNLSEQRIKGSDFIRYCQECGVENSDTTRKGLLDWFRVLGISFYYEPGAKLEEYIILRPEWITNAIYTIIRNKPDQVNNGIVSHEAIYKLLSSKSKKIRRAFPDIEYNPHEVDYVLELLRRFRLSYPLDSKTEFIPMLCKNEKLTVASEYRNDPDTLEFRMRYKLLPKNILHRLMVELHRDLDKEHVWLTGARFRQDINGLSAVVMIKGKVLVIYVRGLDSKHQPHTYLNTFRSALADIHMSMNMEEPESVVVYKKDGKSEIFHYEDLIGNLENGQNVIFSRQQKRMISIDDILNQSDREVERKKKKLLDDVAEACLELQGTRFLQELGENDRNTYLRNALSHKDGGKDYVVKDQTLMGVGAGKKRDGEPDLLIEFNKINAQMICEAMIITGSSRSQVAYWNQHLDRLLVNYNPQGMQDLILISYVKANPEKFSTLWNFYSNHMVEYVPKDAFFQEKIYQEIKLETSQYNCLRIARCTYNLNGMPTTVHHYFLRIGQ